MRRSVTAIGLAFGLLMVSAAVASAPIATFKSTGAEQHYTVPAGVRLVAVLAQGAWGGAFGGGQDIGYKDVVGQNGAAWQGLVSVRPGEKLYVEVGANGTVHGGPSFGGGGAAGTTDPEGAPAASGGGATDVRTCSARATHCPGGGTTLTSRLLVAGGAGGNGGGGVTAGAGLACRAGGGGADATNEQPLPKGNATLGPLPIRTAAGIVIPGLATGDHPTPTTGAGITDAGGGSTAAGRGGSATSCGGGGAYQGNTYSGSVPGRAGAGPNGGAGGNAAGLAPQPCGTPGRCNDAGPGGGGGGGYFGGGGGPSGFDVCTGPHGSSSCGTTNGFGGGSGSSFVAKGVLYPAPAIGGGLGSGVPYARIAPVLEIRSPAGGAVYPAGKIVHASWACTLPPGWGYGVQNCTATTPSGGAINTKPGKHTFTVHGVAHDQTQPIAVTVTYTVR